MKGSRNKRTGAHDAAESDLFDTDDKGSFPGEAGARTGETPDAAGETGSPMGLSSFIHNSDRSLYLPAKDVSEELLAMIRGERSRKKRLDLVLRGVATIEEEVIRLFADAVYFNSFYQIVLEEFDRDMNSVKKFAVPSRSRWNLKRPSHKDKVDKRLRDEVKGLRKAVMVTLTYDPALVVNPYRPYIDDLGYLVYAGWGHVNKFLDALNKYRKRKKLKWNYVCSVLEFQSSGYIHFHLMFYGGWVAPLDVLQKYWRWSQPNGIDVREVSGMNTVAYLTKYLNKSKLCQKGDLYHIGYAWVYYFRVRLYNIRHAKRIQKSGGENSYACLGLAFVPDGKWEGGITFPFDSQANDSNEYLN